jgi:hypothetical protein
MDQGKDTDVYALVNQSLLRYYFQDDILKIEVREIDPLQKPSFWFEMK